MVKPTQAIRRLLLTNCLSVFDHLVEFALKELKVNVSIFGNLIKFYFPWYHKKIYGFLMILDEIEVN